MTTETNSDKQEPRPLSEPELDAVVGGNVPGSTILALAVLRRICLDTLLPGTCGRD